MLHHHHCGLTPSLFGFIARIIVILTVRNRRFLPKIVRLAQLTINTKWQWHACKHTHLYSNRPSVKFKQQFFYRFHSFVLALSFMSTTKSTICAGKTRWEKIVSVNISSISIKCYLSFSPLRSENLLIISFVFKPTQYLFSNQLTD